MKGWGSPLRVASCNLSGELGRAWGALQGLESWGGPGELAGPWGAPRLRAGCGLGRPPDLRSPSPGPGPRRCRDGAPLQGAAPGGRAAPGEAPGETPAAQMASAGREEPERGPRGRLGGECASAAEPGLCECTICRGTIFSVPVKPLGGGQSQK